MQAHNTEYPRKQDDDDSDRDCGLGFDRAKKSIDR